MGTRRGAIRLIRSDNSLRTLVEITGVAGSGKSTVTSILTEGEYARAPFISARDATQLTLFARTLPLIAPLVTKNVRRPPRMTWADFKLMVYVSSWDTYLDKTPAGGTIVFDQGPLYALVRLRAKGIGVASTPSFARWWSRMLDKWLDEISLFVLLDASDDILLERVNRRHRGHDLKGAAIGDAKEFVRSYRSLFEEIESEIDRRGHPTLLRIDTGRLSAGEVAEAVVDAVEERTEHTS